MFHPLSGFLLCTGSRARKLSEYVHMYLCINIHTRVPADVVTALRERPVHSARLFALSQFQGVDN